MQRIYFLLFTFFITTVINAQKLEHLSYHITPEDGLPDKEIYRILEDKQGFIWLAASSGLYRYDGEEFKMYRHPSQNNSSVFGLILDEQKRLWFNTINGEYFYVKNDRVFLFKEWRQKTRETLHKFSVIDNHLYLQIYNELIKINISTRQDTVFNNMGKISSIVKYKNHVSVLNHKGVQRLDSFSTKDKTLEYLIRDTYAILREKILYFGKTSKGVNRFDLYDYSNSYKVVGLDDIKELSIYSAKYIDDYVWFFTSRGVYKYSFNGKKFKLEDILLEGKQTTDGIINQQGYIWISTLNSGIYVIPNDIYVVKRNFRDDYLTSFIAINDNTIAYIEGKKHLSVFNTKNLNTQYKTLKSFNQRLFYDPDNDNFYVFVGSKLSIYPSYKNLNESYNYQDVSRPKDIVKINKHQLLFSYYHKLSSFNLNNYEYVKDVLGRCKWLGYNTYNNYIYVDFSKGLKLGKSLDSLVLIKYKSKNIYVKSISVRPKSHEVYIVNSASKILLANKDSIVDSIPLNSDYKINTIKCSDNNVYLGTDKGVLIANYNDKKFRKLKKLTNIQVKKIEVTSQFIWIASDDKIIRLPSLYKDAKSPNQKLYFKNILIGGKEVNQDKIIEVKDRTQSINAEFMLNGFKSLKEYQLEYKLSSENWKIINGNKLTVSSLPYGYNTLKVRGVNKSSGYYTKVSQITLKVLKPFYKTVWFLILLIILFILIVYLNIKRYIKEQNKKRAIVVKELRAKHQLTNLKLENLRSQMNPHFIFNSLNSIQEYIYNNEKELASSYLVKFSRLIRIYLEHSRMSETLLSREVEALKLYLYLENNRFEDTLDYTIHLDDKIDKDKISVPSLFIQPYVENAIKHGLLHKRDNKKLEISFKLNKDKSTLLIYIKDNGIGREASSKINDTRQHVSFATKANSNRVELINLKRNIKIEVKFSDLKDNLGKPLGTLVTILIPLKNYN